MMYSTSPLVVEPVSIGSSPVAADLRARQNGAGHPGKTGAEKPAALHHAVAAACGVCLPALLRPAQHSRCATRVPGRDGRGLVVCGLRRRSRPAGDP
ncbi:MAG: hypothetical protein U1E33_05085 [Rhodospirillales bacterium]